MGSSGPVSKCLTGITGWKMYAEFSIFCSSDLSLNPLYFSARTVFSEKENIIFKICKKNETDIQPEMPRCM